MIRLQPGENRISDEYVVRSTNDPILVLRFGFSEKPKMRKGISAIVDTVHEFKHYRKDGSKFWTAKIGFEAYVVVPRDQVFLVPQETSYSYPKVMINGQEIKLSVTGMSGGPDGVRWTDLIGERASTFVNVPKRVFYKVCEIGTGEAVSFNLPDPSWWRQFRSPELLTPGNQVVLQRHIHADGHSRGVYLAGKKPLRCKFGNAPFRIRHDQVDWNETLVANGIPIPEPGNHADQ